MTIYPQKIIDLALKYDVSEAEVYQLSSLSHPVFFEANRLKQLQSKQSQGTALRLWKQGRPGLAVAYGFIDSQELVEKAIALSQLNPPKTMDLSEPRIAIYPETGSSISVETLISTGKTAINQLRDTYPEAICSGEFSCEQHTTLLMNSQGLHCQYQETSINYYLGLEWVRGENFLGIYDGELTRNQLNPDKVIKWILQRLQWANKNVSPPTGKIPIMFTPDAVTMLWETVADAINGKRVLENSSPWNGKLGEVVMSPKITLFQDPQRYPYTLPFDDEGTPTQLLPLITEGQLKYFYSDHTIARKLGQKSTGNGFRLGLEHYPTPSLVNMIIESGTQSFEELISQLDNALIVDQMLGGGADISGEFSINVDLGYRIEKGEITGRVKDTMVAGNIYTALKQVIGLGNDSRWNGSCYTPSLLVEGLSVIGK
ncbi:putative peptidase U62, modulator of DNA gyrase [cyanobacterium endosymbiont of Rhopalodia gibberula]|uniref:TldD/PmbA family protein n=1 Tax=cyanobacterium endosymbiont of Rhopalodia gibberula TaxID=1763363 RepID=UPI000DC72DB8|nr:TldD/PmbA family protein [cyanobacterium endosymbiont of Rhopalodia gibberula]BBA78910.1 putative peptidase U62, modulator of DNA gyrase [cyanobacterium endosymbiont of Rhopalodia gibberula]